MDPPPPKEEWILNLCSQTDLLLTCGIPKAMTDWKLMPKSLKHLIEPEEASVNLSFVQNYFNKVCDLFELSRWLA